jgi:hypothetical protein
VEALAGKITYYSGLHLSLLTPQELGLATKLSQKAGASGIVLFAGNRLSDDYWKYMEKEL